MDHSLTKSDNMSFKSSLDNSGPSSIESQSTKTLTSGPSSLESHRTVIARQNSGPSSLDSQSTITELKARKSPKSLSRRRDNKSPVVTTKTPKMTHSNSFTLQVTTNQNGATNTILPNATTTATINSGSNTKIFVQNSPVRSVITFENGQADPNVVIINGNDVPETNVTETKVTNETNEDLRKNKKNVNANDENLNNTKEQPAEKCIEEKIEMNNSRKLSLQLPNCMNDNLSYKNFLKNVPSSSCNQFCSNSNPGSPIINGFREFTKNTFSSNPPTPTKSFDNIAGSIGTMYEKYLANSKTALEKAYENGVDLIPNCKIVEKNTLGSEPNLTSKISDNNKTLTRENSRDYQFPSLSDLSFNFTSLAAQKILKGVSINSIDTLVELNMAATAEKQNNCDVVHTDFGLV